MPPCILKFSDSHPFSASENCFLRVRVINSGATDHMTNSSHRFSSYSPYPGNRKIKVVDGTLATVASQGTINLSLIPSLKLVLHILRLSVNFLFVYEITKDLKCRVTFFQTQYVFQDQATRKMTGHTNEQEGLYLLKPCCGNRDYNSPTSPKAFHLIRAKFGCVKIEISTLSFAKKNVSSPI